MGKFIMGDDFGIINMDKAKGIFYGTAKKVILASYENGKDIPLLPLETNKEGTTAIKIIAERMRRDDVVFMPTVDEIRLRISQDSTRYTHMKGEKTKGHGGS
jgi:hypothetical protein